MVVHGYFLETTTCSFDLAATVSNGRPPDFDVTRLPDYLRAGFRSAIAAAIPSVTGGGELTWLSWVLRQGRMATEWFTWPAAIGTLFGGILALVRRTPGLIAGASLLVPGILNLVVFRAHASEHQYWQYYLLPGIVVLTMVVLHDLAQRTILSASAAGAIAVSIVVLSTITVDAHRKDWKTDVLPAVARELDSLLSSDDAILVCDMQFAPMTFYTQKWSVATGLSKDVVGHLRRFQQTGSLRREVVFLFTPRLGGATVSQIESDLATYGAVERLDPPQVERRLPHLYRSLMQGPIWLVRMT
jgi:hypothetical protein